MQQTFPRTLRTYPKRLLRAAQKRRQSVICPGDIQEIDAGKEALMASRCLWGSMQTARQIKRCRHAITSGAEALIGESSKWGMTSA